MTPLEYKHWTSLLLLLPLFLVIAVSMLFVYAALRWARHRGFDAQLGGVDPLFAPTKPGFGLAAALFDQPTRWVAVKSSDLKAVQSALGLRGPVPCSWEEGLAEARDQKLFVSQPVAGWVMVVGSLLPDPSDDVDECFRFLVELSRKVGLVQFFSTNRVVNHHAWALLDEGHVFRGYAWAGETLWNQGAFTAAEKELDMRCHEYCAEQPEFGKDPLLPNSEKVNRLAAKWSLDPATIIERELHSRHGIVGRSPFLRLH